MVIDLRGGLDDEREYVFATQPDDPEMRESVNAWVWDSGTQVGMPRIGVEAVADQWETHDIQVNIAFADGRVLTVFAPGEVHDPLGADGRPRILGAGPLSFELVEPFRHWRMHLGGFAIDSTVEDQIAGRRPSEEPSVPVEFDVDILSAVPPWENGELLPEAKRVLEEQDEGALMGGPRYEQLSRATGTLRVGDRTHRIDGGALRIRRQGIRRLGTFRGHVWQSVLFPSGRAFGYIVYPPRDDGLPTYNEGYLFEGDGELIPARVVEAPWLHTLQPGGQDVSVVLESEQSTTRIQAESVLSCFAVMGGIGPGTEGFPVLQQAIVRYAWDGETATGMMERSLPGNRLDPGQPEPFSMATGTARTGTPPTVRARIDELVKKAKTETGLDDFGGDSWREGLEVLVRAAETEASFNDFGEESFYASLVRPLKNRLRVEDWYRRYPEIDDQDVQVELLGVGFPRTGSTALSHLLAEDPAFRNLRMWEESDPCPPPGVSSDADEARMEAARTMVSAGQEHMAERLRSMLPQSAVGPTEDHDLMALEFKAQFFLVSARIPSYAEWFINCDMEPTYRYERRVLKLLQWKTREKVWRLKSPTHTMFLEDYEKVFPEARFVQTHRDVAKVLPSVCDLYYTMLQAGNPGIDPLYVGDLNMEQWGVALDRMLAFRKDPARDAMFFDMGFTQFQADPIAEIHKLYDWLGDAFTEDTINRMLAWRANNPRDKYGKHEYDVAQFGITDESLSKRFGAYRERFGALLS